MFLMALDHVDGMVNPLHSTADSRFMEPVYPLPLPDFLVRWSTHLCAPTFVFLAGAGIALAAARQHAPNAARALDRHLLARASVLLALEFTFLSACFRTIHMPLPAAFTSWRPLIAQVLFAIGCGMALMVPLRRLADSLHLAIAVALMVAIELAATSTAGQNDSWLLSLLLLRSGPWSHQPGPFDVLVLYPVLAWLPVMLLGHVAGRRLAQGLLPARAWWRLSAIALAVFLLVRGLGIGDLGLHRRDDSVAEWLHCSKYPPSLSFVAMELSLMAALLGLVLHLASLPASANGRTALDNGPLRLLRILGEVPLFFYLLHLVLIGALSSVSILPRSNGTWVGSIGGAVLVTAIALPLCSRYRDLKRSGRCRFTRYL